MLRMTLRKILKNIRHRLEYAPLWLIYTISQFFSYSQVSAFGALLGSFAGRFYPSLSNVADKNLKRILPNSTKEERLVIIQKACRNYGRLFLEYFVLHKAPHDPKYSCKLINIDKVTAVRQKKTPYIFLSGHLDNWEVGALACKEMGNPLIPIYRRINNPYVDRLILKCRSFYVNQQIPKGDKAGFNCLKALKRGETLVFLGDQKYNQGPDIPFFGHDARTADGFVKIAQIGKAYIIPLYVTRIAPTEFELSFEDPIDTTDEKLDVNDILCRLNKHFENWISKNPDQWFIFHRRWDKAYYTESK